MANWLQPLLGGVGTVLGGPLGGVAGSVLGGALGGGGGQPAAKPAATSNLSEQLRQMAFQRGFLEAMGGGPAQSFAPALAQVQQGQQAPQPAASRKSGQRANQAGGAGYSPLQRYFGDAGGGAPSAKTQNTTDEALYQRYLQQSMAGQGGLPAGAYQSALTQGTAAIANQAQVAQQGLQGNLAQRGLLSSGLYGSGMGQIAQGRMQAMGQFATNLQQSNLEAQRGAQSNAAQLYAAQRNQETAINAAKPTTWDYLAGLVGAGVNYLTQPNVPQVAWPGQGPAAPAPQPVAPTAPATPTMGYTMPDELWRQAYRYY